MRVLDMPATSIPKPYVNTKIDSGHRLKGLPHNLNHTTPHEALSAREIDTTQHIRGEQRAVPRFCVRLHLRERIGFS